MRKKLIITVAVVAVLALAIPAFAATVNGLNSEQVKKINQLHQEMIKLRMKMVDEYQAAGLIDKSQAQLIKNNMQNRLQYIQQNPGAFGPMGPGYGGRWNGGGPGPGRGYGCGGWGNCPYYQQIPQTNNQQ
ncbi:hypothetical protein JOC37_001861 [Desulfohalotomaculum tongense]|uniref:DUF2680 domain-containing protein n=1 Tax=Desulforadius tongensis TaxID=1216062 RepID=UPI00195DDDE6|nr:DUF2680 domain-containing protein [Desulforadius tongensis]MBM7855464.1 hypothetical protein [Desulforadius tongensis]